MSIPSLICPLDVYRYICPREFLRDYYVAKKREKCGFSHRAFSRALGVSSPNHLKRVMEGTRNLTPQMARRYAATLGLSPKETAYFLDLVTLD